MIEEQDIEKLAKAYRNAPQRALTSNNMGALLSLDKSPK